MESIFVEDVRKFREVVNVMKFISAFYIFFLVMVFSFQSFAQNQTGVPLRDIFFNEGEFVIREDAKPVLRENAQTLITNPDYSVEVVGFCNSGEYSFNFNLGMKRAEAVRSFLVNQGIESQRISLSAVCDHGKDNIVSEVLEVKLRLNSRVHLNPVLKHERGVL
ncbi:MAG: OmpA family protein [Deltaproteobacteria bacterium]